MKEIMIILFSAILVENVVLSKLLGVPTFLGVSKKANSALGISVAVTFVMVLSSAATWPIQTYLLKPNGLDYMNTLVFILTIVLIAQLSEIILKKYIKSLHKTLGVYLPLITTNCAILGLTLLNIQSEYTFLETMVNALGTGIGFTIAMLLFSGVRSKLEHAVVPKCFEGLPIALVSAAIVSLSFMGFAGIAENIL